MAYDGAAWNEATPTDSTLANEIDDNMRDMKTAVRGRMAQEHIWANSQSATNEAGLHKYLTLAAQTSAPALVVGTNTQQGALYINSTNNNLIFIASDSSETILVAGSTETGGTVPAGVVVPYAATKSPSGWILCTGGAVSRTTYARLFNVLGTVWGTGDGSTTFNVPDMRGSIPAGHSAGGAFATFAGSTGALEHVHTGTVSFSMAQTYFNWPDIYVYPNDWDANPNIDHKHTFTTDTQTTIQPTIVMNYIIKD